MRVFTSEAAFGGGGKVFKGGRIMAGDMGVRESILHSEGACEAQESST